jgi:hypothetical protein
MALGFCGSIAWGIISCPAGSQRILSHGIEKALQAQLAVTKV